MNRQLRFYLRVNILKVLGIFALAVTPVHAAQPLEVGMAQRDITPPDGFPMAGYYHERLSEGTIDPLLAKAIVFRQGDTTAALVVCDLIGVTSDLASAIRTAASKSTGIPYESIIVAATHSHTAPDYYKSLEAVLTGDRSDAKRSAYIDKLIAESAAAIADAAKSARKCNLSAGSANQTTPVSFNRRFVMRDGTVRTWMSYANKDTIKAAGPIDSDIAMLLVKSADSGEPIGLLSNFALHLDTVGGSKWSADYPKHIAQCVHEALGPNAISLFATGCCGDINHSDPRATSRNKTDFIGKSLGTTIRSAIPKLAEVEKDSKLSIRHAVVELPLQDCSPDDVARSIEVLKTVDSGKPVDFFDHVRAHKLLMVDQFRHNPPLATSSGQRPFLRTKKWAGVGATLPTEVHAITLGEDLAIVTLPGEVFVDLGLAIKQASPYKNTIIVELANAVETIYVPTRAAHAGGSYEVLNSTVKPGSGEMLVEAALKLLKESRQAMSDTVK